MKLAKIISVLVFWLWKFHTDKNDAAAIFIFQRVKQVEWKPQYKNLSLKIRETCNKITPIGRRGVWP